MIDFIFIIMMIAMVVLFIMYAPIWVILGVVIMGVWKIAKS